MRRRRTAEEAREAILAAAERRFIETGPEGLRLQEIAKDVGVSHPTVLHHFGSREELVTAVLARVQGNIYGEVFAALAETDLRPDSLEQLLERVAQVLAAHGHARVLYWLALTNRRDTERKPLGDVIEVAHRLRKQRAKERGELPASREDTRFLVMLGTFALTAQSVLGGDLFGAGAPAEPRFRAWLARLLAAHLERATGPSAPAATRK